MPVTEKTYYTVVLQGNIAGFPVKEVITNATKVVGDDGKLRVTVGDISVFLSPKEHECVQVAKQDGYITEAKEGE